MKKRLRILRDCRGEMSYISTVIGVFVLLLFVVLAVNVFSVLTMRQNMQQVIDLTLDRLAADGSTENAALYFSAACGKAGIAAEVPWKAQLSWMRRTSWSSIPTFVCNTGSRSVCK